MDEERVILRITYNQGHFTLSVDVFVSNVENVFVGHSCCERDWWNKIFSYLGKLGDNSLVGKVGASQTGLFGVALW